ncbi:MAG: histone-like nucleoid-structuring protein Lsr2 [Actinomycetes bacterium]
MKVTIDSSDPLEQALKVLGSLYGVELSVASSNGAGEAEAPPAPAEEETAQASGGRRRGRKSAEGTSARRSARKSAGKRASLDMGAVRTWARENGYEVSDRGRVPNAVVSAYQESGAAG